MTDSIQTYSVSYDREHRLLSRDRQEQRDGNRDLHECYHLHSTLDLEDRKLWNLCITHTRVEDAFRSMKSELGLIPSPAIINRPGAAGRTALLSQPVGVTLFFCSSSSPDLRDQTGPLLNQFREPARRHRSGQIGGAAEMHHFIINRKGADGGRHDDLQIRTEAPQTQDMRGKLRQHAVQQNEAAVQRHGRLRFNDRRIRFFDLEPRLGECINPGSPWLCVLLFQNDDDLLHCGRPPGYTIMRR